MNWLYYVKIRIIRKWRIIYGFNLVNYKIEYIQFFYESLFRCGFIFNDYKSYVSRSKIQLKKRIYVLFFMLFEISIILLSRYQQSLFLFQPFYILPLSFIRAKINTSMINKNLLSL